MTEQILDSMSPGMLLVLFAIVSMAVYELGFRIGRWWQARMPGEQEGPTDVLVGSLLGLMAFLLAITMGMAADRFDARRGFVVAEANAIGAAYLQSNYLPQPQAEQMQQLLREYLPLRIAPEDSSQVEANLQQSRDLQVQMWTITRDVARSGYLSDLVSAFGDSLTEVVNVDESRAISGLVARVPESVLLLLIVGSVLSLGMLGYSAGIRGVRSVLSAVVLTVALGVVLALVVDLDRPQQGLINVSQQALLDVQARIGPP